MANTLLSPLGNATQLFDNEGKILVNGKIFTYLSGTTTPEATYSDLDGNVPNENPIVLDSSGRVPVQVRLVAGTAYTFVITDQDDIVLSQTDNVEGIPETFGGDTVTIPFWINTNQTPVKVDDTTFVINGNWSEVFHDERRIRLLQSGGYIYGSILSCVVTEPSLGSFLSTVELRIDNGQVILSDVSECAYSAVDSVGSPIPVDQELIDQVAALTLQVTALAATVAAALVTINNAIPLGALINWPVGVPPDGWVECNGDTFLRTDPIFTVIGTSYGVGNGTTTANYPDFRGTFLRGWDNGRGIDTGRLIGTLQTSQMQAHNHSTGYYFNNYTADNFTGGWSSVVSDARAGGPAVSTTAGGTSNGNETRPVNNAVMVIMRVTA
jgi:microcystin-dependent protein